MDKNGAAYLAASFVTNNDVAVVAERYVDWIEDQVNAEAAITSLLAAANVSKDPDKVLVAADDYYVQFVVDIALTVAEGPVDPIASYGAVGDGITDDTAAMQAAINALPASGGLIFIRPGSNHKVSNLVLRSGVIIEGAGPASVLTAPAGADLFSVPNSLIRVALRDLRLASAAGGGHLMSVAAGKYVTMSQFERLTWIQPNAGKSAISILNGEWIDNTISDCEFDHSLTATVPTINMLSSTNGLNRSTWRDLRFVNSGAYSIYLEATGGAYCYDNLFEGINFEIANGGAIKILSGMANLLQNCAVYDLSGATTNDLFVIGKAAASPASSQNTLRNCSRRGGALGGGLADIRLGATNGAVSTTIEGCNNSTGTGFVVDYNGNSGNFRGSTGVTLQNADVVNVTYQYTIRTARTSTGNRSSATTQGQGSQQFDTTLNKPIWSDGTNWKVGATMLTGVATLDFPSIAANSQQELTITVTGAVANDAVTLGPPTTLTAGLTWDGYVSAADTVKVRLTNTTGSAIDPASATWRATVIR